MWGIGTTYLVERVGRLLQVHAALHVALVGPFAGTVRRPRAPAPARARAAFAVAEKHVSDVFGIRRVGVVGQVLRRVVLQRPVALPAVHLERQKRGQGEGNEGRRGGSRAVPSRKLASSFAKRGPLLQTTYRVVKLRRVWVRPGDEVQGPDEEEERVHGARQPQENLFRVAGRDGRE